MSSQSTRAYLAIDFGATSRRAIIGRFNGSCLTLEEAYRFESGMVRTAAGLCWNMPEILQYVTTAVASAQYIEPSIASIACDAWGVDHGFLNANNELVDLPFSYQEPRTQEVFAAVSRDISPAELQARTAVPVNPILSVFQLLATRVQHPEQFSRASTFLFISDLVHHFLCGARSSELCIASTSGVMSWQTSNWDAELISRLGLPIDIFPEIRKSGDSIGETRSAGIGASKGCTVRVAAGHDTASAFAAVPAAPDDVIISSGTWSMLGLISPKPVIAEGAAETGFGNYALPGDRWGFMKGLMGLFLLEKLRREENTGTIAELCRSAEKAPPFTFYFDPSDTRFRTAENLISELRAWCQETDQPFPDNQSAIVRAILENLALFYAGTIRQLGTFAEIDPAGIFVIGGGSLNRLLNQFTANATQLPVTSGLVEATACGNVLIQAVGAKDLASFEDIPEIIRRSFAFDQWHPSEPQSWATALQKFDRIKSLAEQQAVAAGK